MNFIYLIMIALFLLGLLEYIKSIFDIDWSRKTTVYFLILYVLTWTGYFILTHHTEREHERQQEETLQIKQQQEKTAEIEGVISNVENGSRAAYDEFEKLFDDTTLTEKERNRIELADNGFRKIFEDDVKEHSSLRYVDSDTKKPMNLSMERLYLILISSNVGGVDLDDRRAVMNEIGINKNEYFVKVLYDIAVNDEDITLSISAAQAICDITDHAPYRRKDSWSADPEDKLIYDIPKYGGLIRWWENEGKNNGAYLCPFHKLVSKDTTYFSYDRGIHNKQRLILLQNILDKYPKLQRTKAEIGYLKLNGEDTYQNIKNTALQVLEEADKEPLPYALLAYISWKEGNKENFRYWISTACEKSGVFNIRACVQINKKINEIYDPVIRYIQEKKINENSKFN